eukprot:c40130_g1_i1.p1 GENE.c40130_g1_i1~~c40130_g1_i1.p1  ORF type:complete len:281 (-),score=47.94 c40130_g1_i1:93-935(-)
MAADEPPKRSPIKDIPGKLLSPEWKRSVLAQCKADIRKNRQSLVRRLRARDRDDERAASGGAYFGDMTAAATSEFDAELSVRDEVARLGLVPELIGRAWHAVREESGSRAHAAPAEAGPASMDGDEPEVGDGAEPMDLVPAELIAEIAEEIQESLIEEYFAEIAAQEEAHLDDVLQFEEESARASARGTPAVGDFELLCPVCQVNRVLEHKGVIFCQCGMRLAFKDGGLTLRQLRLIIEDQVGAHHAGCAGVPAFQIQDIVATRFLVMTCIDCAWFEIIA